MIPTYPKMYILVNSSLKMGSGKIAAQVGHVVQMIIESIYTQKHTEERHKTYDEWKISGMAKIVLGCSAEEIETFALRQDVQFIRDLGKTQVAPNSLTAVAFYPVFALPEVEHLKLLN